MTTTRPEDYPLAPEDSRFAGLVLVTSALKDVADELKSINWRLERLINALEVREERTWRISRKP